MSVKLININVNVDLLFTNMCFVLLAFPWLFF